MSQIYTEEQVKDILKARHGLTNVSNNDIVVDAPLVDAINKFGPDIIRTAYTNGSTRPYIEITTKAGIDANNIVKDLNLEGNIELGIRIDHTGVNLIGNGSGQFGFVEGNLSSSENSSSSSKAKLQLGKVAEFDIGADTEGNFLAGGSLDLKKLAASANIAVGQDVLDSSLRVALNLGVDGFLINKIAIDPSINIGYVTDNSKLRFIGHPETYGYDIPGELTYTQPVREFYHKLPKDVKTSNTYDEIYEIVQERITLDGFSIYESLAIEAVSLLGDPNGDFRIEAATREEVLDFVNGTYTDDGVTVDYSDHDFTITLDDNFPALLESVGASPAGNSDQFVNSEIKFTDVDGNTTTRTGRPGDHKAGIENLGAGDLGDKAVAVTDADGNTTTWLEKGATTVINGTTYVLETLADVAQSSAEALTNFVETQTTLSTEYWTTSQAEADTAIWLGNNIICIVDGTLDPEDAFVDLAKFLAVNDNQALRRAA